MKDFKNKLVFITGGSSGIGFAAADAFIKAGADVYLYARNEARLAEAVGLLEQSNSNIRPGSIKSCPLDVTDSQAVNRCLSRIMNDSGVPDIVVNCAGIAYPDYFENISNDLFKKTIAVNLEGPWNVLSTAIPAMKKAGKRGHIVTTASVAGFVGTFGYTAYSASKFGVIGLSETLRGELKPYGISVSVLCPPDTDTPGFKEENKTKPPETVAISGNARLMQPEQVAGEILRGIRKNKFMIIPGFMGKLTFLLKSLMPGLLFRIMDNEAGKIKNGVLK